MTEPTTSADGVYTASHLYADAGVCTVEVTVINDSGASDTETFQYVVIYDPSAGFVTGSGWINSPAGGFMLTTIDGQVNGGAGAWTSSGSKSGTRMTTMPSPTTTQPVGHPGFD